MNEQRKYVFSLLAIFTASIVVQLVLLPGDIVGPDTWKYFTLAEMSRSSDFWADPSAFDYNYWPMGYPTFVGAIWFLTGGVNPYLIQLIQVLMAASLVFVISPFTRGFSLTVRLVSAGFVGASTSVISTAQNGGYELLLSLLLLISLGIVWGNKGVPTARSLPWNTLLMTTAGTVYGLSFLVQNKTVILAPVFAIFAWRWGRKFFALFSISAIVPPLLWAWRNLLVAGSFSPFSTNGPINLWIGNNPRSVAGGFMEPLPLPVGSDTFEDASAAFLINQPEATVTLYLRKLARLFEPTYLYPEITAPPRGFSTILHYSTAIVALAFVFLFFACLFALIWRVGGGITVLTPLVIFYLLFVLVNLPFLAEPRYRTPHEPLLIVIGVLTAKFLLGRYKIKLRSMFSTP
jgi:hypothetical protein